MNVNDLKLNRRALLAGASLLATASVGTAAVASEDVTVDFSGKSVLITGTSSGFGRLSAIHLARLGATVIASMRKLDRGKRPEAVELKTLAKEENLDLHVIEIDVISDKQVKRGVAKAEKIAGGALDVLINNAGIGLAGPIEINDTEATQLIFETNLFGYQRMARAVLPKMRDAKSGQIFNVSSQLGRLLLPNIGMYCATKFAVEAMFETMAYELAPFGVDITIIQPGGYPTKIWDKGRVYYNDLIARLDDDRKEDYSAHLQMAEGFFNGGGTTDPMDIPRAIAEIMAMPTGQRPLRKPVHPNTMASDTANAAMAKIQSAVLSQGPYAKWHKRVAG
ncbi:MAG: SDR family oxidoreductase [Acidimicrobiales bacterium]|nr:SDR family oxidoreductase [Hyphomonadaceae bacterium]RZV42900.1 MAG: SDR family oxidoreductase [Acidimicrobiales bacterium]